MSLLLDPPPTLQCMLEICAHKVIIPSRDLDHQARPSPWRITVANTLEAALVDPAPSFSPPHHPSHPRTPGPVQKNISPCHLCGKIGHWRPDCPLRRQFYEFKKQQGIWGKNPPTTKKLGAERSPLLRKDIKKACFISSCREGNKAEPPTTSIKCDLFSLDLSCLLCLQPMPILTTSKSESFRLQLTEPLYRRNSDFHLVTVCPECPGNWG